MDDGVIVNKMCKGCVRVKNKKCLVQTDPLWLYLKYGECWSKLTDWDEAKRIEEAVREYCLKP